MRFHGHLSPLVNVPLACGLAVTYTLLGLLGNRLMANRAPAELTTLKLVYNISQVVVCSLTFAKLLPFYLTAEHGFGTNIAPQPDIEFWVFVYYCCKLLDFGDTFFIVLGRKTRQFTLLHVWHHASIVPLFAFYLSAGLGAGFVSALPLLNSLVHVLMYSHYLVTSLVSPKKIWWKPLLTGAQIGHHVVLLFMMVMNRVSGNPECTFSVFIWAVLWGLSIIALFANFYVQQYMKGGAKKA
mmetsp:Transcript_17856/g.39159  ORF Transcript_17856/g.39159 Transcript_17856/m.39159 type:complete len:240 (+) Transcript_17856:70-789(+)